jgi:hypothetical protein
VRIKTGLFKQQFFVSVCKRVWWWKLSPIISGDFFKAAYRAVKIPGRFIFHYEERLNIDAGFPVLPLRQSHLTMSRRIGSLRKKPGA